MNLFVKFTLNEAIDAFSALVYSDIKPRLQGRVHIIYSAEIWTSLLGWFDT